ncbi:MAG: zinc ribbon domain-containing protein, partial [Acutalibacteraceae bacterium]
MKKCPYCSAELLDDAEFCLYCMRGLSEKRFAEHKLKKPYLKFAVTGVLTALVICAVLITVLKFGLKGTVIHNSDSTSLPTQNAQGIFFESNGYSEKQSDANGTSHSAENSSVGYSSNGEETAYTSVASVGSDNKTAVISSNSISSSASVTDKGGSSDGNSKVENGGEASGTQSDTETQESSSQAPSDSTAQEQPQQTWSVKSVDG